MGAHPHSRQRCVLSFLDTRWRQTAMCMHLHVAMTLGAQKTYGWQRVPLPPSVLVKRDHRALCPSPGGNKACASSCMKTSVMASGEQWATKRCDSVIRWRW